MSGACYAGDWEGKPTGQPGLAKYWTEQTINGVTVCAKWQS